MKIGVFYGSVYGAAEQLAEQVVMALKPRFDANLIDSRPVDAVLQSDALLVITSTTGQGDIPADLQDHFYTLQNEFPLLKGKPFGVIALGDSSYGESFCGAGVQWQSFLTELQGTEALEMLKIDALETFEPELEAMPWLERWIEKVSE